jgi:predicted amidohydrolase YtcJ
VWVRPQEIKRMKDLGVMPSIAPWFLLTEQNITNTVEMFGADRVNDSLLPIKSYVTTGIRPSLEADSGDDPLGKPFYKLQLAITRKDEKDGRVWNAKEKISRQEALWMVTNWSAAFTGDQDQQGTIERGKLADLVVIGQDYLTIAEDQIGNIPILMTIVGGRIVYDHERKD